MARVRFPVTEFFFVVARNGDMDTKYEHLDDFDVNWQREVSPEVLFSTRSFLFSCFAINLLSAFLSCLMFYLYLENFAVIHHLRYGLVVRISGSHPGGPGSIPGNGILFSPQTFMLNWVVGLEYVQIYLFYIKIFPTPGVEPGPPGWKPDILAVRPRGNHVFARDRTGDLLCVRQMW